VRAAIGVDAVTSRRHLVGNRAIGDAVTNAPGLREIGLWYPLLYSPVGKPPTISGDIVAADAGGPLPFW
jgi:hypothetical protein